MRRFLPFLFLLFLCSPAYGIIAAGQSAIHQATSATACTDTPNSATSAGSLLVILTQENANNTSTVSFSDGTANTWTQLVSNQAPTAGATTAIYYVKNAASISSVTATWTGSLSTTVFCELQEFTGVATSSPLDPNASNPVINTPAGAATSVVSGSLSTNNANAVLIHFVTIPANVSTWSSTGGFTVNAINNVHGALAYLIVSATQSSLTVTMSWNNSNSGRLSVLAAFDAPGGAAAPTGPSKARKLELIDD